MLSRFSHVWQFATLWTVASQAPLSVGFSRQEHWSGVPLSPPGDLPCISYVSCIGKQVLYELPHKWYYMVFVSLLLTLSMKISRSIHVAANGNISFFFFYCLVIDYSNFDVDQGIFLWAGWEEIEVSYERLSKSPKDPGVNKSSSFPKPHLETWWGDCSIQLPPAPTQGARSSGANSGEERGEVRGERGGFRGDRTGEGNRKAERAPRHRKWFRGVSLPLHEAHN